MLETRSTSLQVEVGPGPGVSAYALYIDGIPATMGSSHKGEVACAGRCGDGSSHALLYSFSGAAGATLAVAVRCGAHVVCSLQVEMVGDRGARSRAGREVFAI
ncbi:MAG TPA: hypothetical protein VE053_15265 [Allosphingosinicella sp.]|nr:hypothetical protein [Allosphingosinicella sp.]